jgi:RNA polymerase sigma factor (sigma-70 family)
MPDAQDMELVREFARDNSEAAFTELVRRHINLVYSVARRCTGNDGDAHDVTQAVFIILARKAAGLREKTLLTGWLYETTRFTAARLLRTNARRHAREQEAYMQSTLNEADNSAIWEKLSPHLETAMGKLNAADRALLVLRFYENKSGPEAAALLGIREDAAHKRVTRAIEKLRKVFAQRGVTISGTAIAGAVSANSVQAAPVALVKTISVTAVAKGAAATTSTLTLVKGALKIMAWSKAKTVIVASAVVLFAGGLTWIAPQWIREWRDSRINFQVEGTLNFSVNGKPGTHYNFTAFVKSDKWLIHFPIQTNGLDYQEDSFDGVSVYRYTQDTAVLGSNNSSSGIVEANDIPDLGGSTDQTTPVWLAYGSARYFEKVSGNKMKSFFFVNRRSPELQQGPYMEAEWKHSASPPFVPTYIYFQKLNYRYQVLQFTNFDGLSVPSEFLQEYFGIGRGITNEPVISVHGFLTKISKLNTDQNFRPQLDGSTYTEDRRFPGNAANYINVSTNWFSTNSPEWRALLKMYDAKAGGLVWPRNHVGMNWPN